ncbi:MAG: tetratricopeptide repeat protein, partial [Pseudomonadota bacterium]
MLIELAESLGALGQTGRAEAEWRRALALRPADPRILNGLASLLFLKGEADEAWALSASALAQYPGLPGPWHGRGLGHFVAGDLTRAAEDFHTSLDIETSNPLVHFNLALINARNGDEAAAAEMLDTALRTGERALLPASIRSLQPAAAGAALPDLPAGRAVVSVIPDLAGGGALAASMVCDAIGPSRPQVILTGSRGRFTGEGHHRLVADLDVPVVEIAGTGDLRDAIKALRPAVVVNHWWPSAAFKPLCRVGNERLILNSTSPVPLPRPGSAPA